MEGLCVCEIFLSICMTIIICCERFRGIVRTALPWLIAVVVVVSISDHPIDIIPRGEEVEFERHDGIQVSRIVRNVADDLGRSENPRVKFVAVRLFADVVRHPELFTKRIVRAV
jgi:hypothetical protein